MGASQSTELQIFFGGLNLMPASHLIKQEEARAMAEANLRKGNLAPFLVPLFKESASDNFVFYFDAEFHYYSAFRSNVLYNKVWYWTDIFGAGKEYEDGTQLPLGIAPPIGRPTISSTPPTEGEGLTGHINYVYTYYDPVSGSESPPSPPSLTLDLLGINASQAVIVEDYDISPDGYETRLYRIGGIITAYSSVITLEPTVLSYLDQLAFSEIEAVILDTLRAYPPPTGLQYLTEHQGRFYGTVGSKLYFSAPGKPDSWYVLDNLGFDEVITGIVSVANGLIVMIDSKCWLVSGISPIQFVKHTLSDSEGCVGFASIAVNEGTAIWLSRAGFVMSNGGKVQNISLEKIGRFKAMTPLGAVFIDKRYFLSFTGVLLPSENLFPDEELYPGSIVNDGGLAIGPGAVVIDFAMGAPAFATMSDATMGQLLIAENELYHMTYDEPEKYNIVTEDGEFNIVTEDGTYNLAAQKSTGQSLVQTLGGDELRELLYVSPVLTEQSIGTLKQYEKIRITYSGALTITARDEDSRLFITQDLFSVGRKSEWVGIPVGFNRGYGIQFVIQGKCIVDSIMYNWTPKEAQ